MNPSKPTYPVSPDALALPREAAATGAVPGQSEMASAKKEMVSRKSVALDRAYEEYCQRREAGQPPDPDEFCKRYPRFQTSLRRLIEVHRCIEETPSSFSPPIHWPEPGDSFLGFTIVEELGRGAFARVFLAAEPALGNREVAIKVSLEGAAEAQTLGRLEHPNIVPVHSVQKEELSGLNVVCMPYLGSATLCDVLDRAFVQPEPPSRARVILEAAQGLAQSAQGPADKRAPSPWLQKGTYIEGVVHLAAQLADALGFVHAKGICHRDLKPSNILLTPDGTPMLLDFNLSFDKQRTEKRLGGTLPYMAPEHLRAADPQKGEEPPEVDERSDLFSFGVILYELLSGRHPFGPMSLKQSFREARACLLERQKQGPQPLRESNRQVDWQLAQLVESCLAYDPANRPTAATQLVKILRERLARVERARQFRTVLGVSVLVLVTGVAGVSFLHERHPYERGLEAYQQGKFERAVSWLNRAVQSQPMNANALYWRGRAHQKRGNLDLALADYRGAHQLDADGKNNACLGYCMSCLGRHWAAIAWFEAAINEGFATAEVHNDLGCCYFQTSQFPKAQTNLDLATRLDPHLQAAFYNRALLDLKKAAKSREYVPEAGLADIQVAIQLGPQTAELSNDAARLFAIAANRDRTLLDPALGHVRHALEQGYPPHLLEQDEFFRILRADPRFQELLRQPISSRPSRKAVRLVDPIRDFSD
jgi:serine/threonine protein kinase/Tfp pilus assembly protein PilF